MSRDDDLARARAAQALLADDLTQIVSVSDRALVLRRWVEPSVYSKFASALVGRRPNRVPSDSSLFGAGVAPVEPDGEALTIAWLERRKRREQAGQ